MSVASADVGFHPVCAGIDYDPANPYHILYPTSLDFNIKILVDQWELWNYRHWESSYLPNIVTDPFYYINFNMTDVSNVVGAPPAGGGYVFFWNDVVFTEVPPIVAVRIVGTPYDDIICGGPDHDVIKGQGGNDLIFGGRTDLSPNWNDDDIITGGPGNDILVGGHGSDGIEGRSGDDTVYGQWPTPDDDVPGGPYPFDLPSQGYNSLWGGSGVDTIYASPTSGDLMVGGPQSDLMVGGGGNDEMVGQGGDDTMQAGIGEDEMWGGPGNDILWGGPDTDWIVGGLGNDTLAGDNPTSTPLTIPPIDTAPDMLYAYVGDDII